LSCRVQPLFFNCREHGDLQPSERAMLALSYAKLWLVTVVGRSSWQRSNVSGPLEIWKVQSFPGPAFELRTSVQSTAAMGYACHPAAAIVWLPWLGVDTVSKVKHGGTTWCASKPMMFLSNLSSHDLTSVAACCVAKRRGRTFRLPSFAPSRYRMCVCGPDKQL
jgi:hypothetical protein